MRSSLACSKGGWLRAIRLFFIPLLLAQCHREAARPPIILISVDTLRSDHLPMYGYRDVATPALDALRADGVLFESAWSHVPLTLPSHASMLTGVLPARHGARDNTGFRLNDGTRTLPAVLKEHGYATAAAISAWVLRGTTGIASGFDSYDDEVERDRREKSLGAVQRPGSETIAVAKKWIGAHAQQPFFYFLHLYEPHAPYDPPEPYRSRYASRYDGEVAYADALAGEFLSFLKQQGIYDRAIIVFVSDHGEGLGDHGEQEHGIFLYRESIAVPMVIKLPAQRLAGRSSSEPAALVDVMPTILRLAGLEPPGGIDGAPLIDGDTVVSHGARTLYSETYYPRFHFGWSELHSLVSGHDHFIDAPRDELYDLAHDAAERQNLAASNRRRYAALRDAIRPFVSEPSAPAAISAEEARKLAALGYIGSASQSAGPRADPKDKIGVFRDLQSAFKLFQDHKDEEALVAFDRLLRTEPGMVDLWDVRSKVLFRLGRTQEGIASAKEALRRNPAATQIAADLANELLLAGDVDGARQHAELALRNDPSRANEILARVALAQGDIARADAAARAAVDANASAPALHTLARVQQKRGDWSAVLATTSRLLQTLETSGDRITPGVHALRGDAFARLGREREAEEAFRRDIQLFPRNAEAYRGLIVLLATENRTDEATQLIRAFANAAPEPPTYRVIADTLEVLGDKAGARYWRSRTYTAKP